VIAALMVYAVAIGLLLALAGTLLERAAAARRTPRRWIWAGLLAAGLALALGLPWTSITSERNGPGAAIRSRLLTVLPAGADGSQASGVWFDGWRWPAPVPDAAGAVSPIAPWLWLAGSSSVALIYTFAWIALRARRRRWRDADLDGQRVLVAFDEGPAVTGLWRPRIVLPEWALARDSRALALILRHEREHVHARDPLVIHLAGLAVLAMPWNPGTWWMWSRLRTAVELDCDARVIGRGAAPAADAVAYAEVLLGVASRPSTRRALIAPAMFERSSSVSRRIAAMHAAPNRFPVLRAAAAVAAATTVLAIALLVPAPNLHAQVAPAPSAGLDTSVSPQPVPQPAPAPSPTPGQAEPPKATPPEATPPQASPSPPPDQNAQREPAEEPVERPGYGITSPTVKRQVDPEYTRAAMDAKIQGVVRLEAVVEPDGTLTRIKVTKSLDQEHGLDQAAIDAASLWEFSPSTKDGKPVPVLIEMVMEFRVE
jgi:TonB family protein